MEKNFFWFFFIGFLNFFFGVSKIRFFLANCSLNSICVGDWNAKSED